MIMLYFSSILQATNQQSVEVSPFSILKSNARESVNDSIKIVRQSIIEGHLQKYYFANIRFLDINTGISTYNILTVNKEHKVNKDFTIVLHVCKKDSEDILAPLNLALISIKKNNKIFLEGWIFSQHTSLFLPKIDDHYIYLDSCSHQDSLDAIKDIK